MNLNSEYIKSLIEQAHELLAQDNIDEGAKRALAQCLRAVYENERLERTIKSDSVQR